MTDDPPTLRVVRGDPTAEDVAALTALMTSRPAPGRSRPAAVRGAGLTRGRAIVAAGRPAPGPGAPPAATSELPMIIAARGDASPGEAWDRYVRPSRWPEWSPQIRSVDFPAERLIPEGRGRVHGPLGVAVDFVVGTVDEAERRWTWRVRWGPVTLRLAHEVIARPDGTLTTLDIAGPVPVVLAYAPVAQVALRQLVAR